MLQQILQKHADLYIQRVTEGFQRNDVNATGKTIASVRPKVGAFGFEVTGAGYILAIEYGRGQTRGGGGGGRSLVDQIKDWIAAKGLDLNPYAVAKSIHMKGTALYRGEDRRYTGNQSGILTEPIKEVNASLRGELTELYRLQFQDKITTAFRKI